MIGLKACRGRLENELLLTSLNLDSRYILMAWGANKFTKKLLRPKAINNNELWDYISRVPDNEELVSFSRIRFTANFVEMK